MGDRAKEPLRLLVVDDDPLVRAALCDYIGRVPDIELVATASDGAAAVDWFRRREPVDVVLMDVRMPVLDGIAATETIKHLEPGTRVVLLTNFDDDDILTEALVAQTAGLLLKSEGLEAIVSAVRAAHHGTVVFSPGPIDRVSARHPEPPPSIRLNEREQQVLELLCRAYSNAEIGRRLYLSESRVKAVVSTLISRFGVDSRLKVVVRAFEWGLVSAVPGMRQPAAPSA